MTDEILNRTPSNHVNAGPNAALRPSMATLGVQFLDLTGQPANPTNPRIQFWFEGKTVPVEALGCVPNDDGSYNVTADIPANAGRYHFSFLPRGLKAGLYRLAWSGTFNNPTVPPDTVRKVVEGTIGLGEISYTQDYVNRVIVSLRDDCPELYQLDDTRTPHWTPTHIYNALREAQGRFNAIGPRATHFQIEDFPTNIDNLLVTGGVIFALYGRARLERTNEMSYSDGHTLTIARADFYKNLADTLYKDWVDAIQQWKRATPPTPIGLKAQQLPFRIYRVVGLLPNYASFFSG